MKPFLETFVCQVLRTITPKFQISFCQHNSKNQPPTPVGFPFFPAARRAGTHEVKISEIRIECLEIALAAEAQDELHVNLRMRKDVTVFPSF